MKKPLLSILVVVYMLFILLPQTAETVEAALAVQALEAALLIIMINLSRLLLKPRMKAKSLLWRKNPQIKLPLPILRTTGRSKILNLQLARGYSAALPTLPSALTLP